jgi:hypothetical protein
MAWAWRYNHNTIKIFKTPKCVKGTVLRDYQRIQLLRIWHAYCIHVDYCFKSPNIDDRFSYLARTFRKSTCVWQNSPKLDQLKSTRFFVRKCGISRAFWLKYDQNYWPNQRRSLLRVSCETSFDSKQPKLVSILSEKRCLFRLFHFNIETACFGVSIDPKQAKIESKQAEN